MEVLIFVITVAVFLFVSFAVVIIFHVARIVGSMALDREAWRSHHGLRPSEETIIYDKEHQRP